MTLVDRSIRVAVLGALVAIPGFAQAQEKATGAAAEEPRGIHGSSRTYPIALHTLRGTDAERVQEALQRFGYYQGPVDGVLGPVTRQALVEFQKDRNLDARGVLDERTVQLLGLDPQELLESRITVGDPAGEFDERVPVRGRDHDADDVMPEDAEGRRSPADPSLGLRGLPEEQVRTLQERLAGLGRYEGPIDGVAGAATYQALLRFQLRNDLPATARLDPTTAARLGLDYLELQRVSGREPDEIGPEESTLPGVGVPDADQVHPHEGPGY